MRMNEAFNCRIINISQHFRPRTFNMFQNDPVLKVSSSSVFVGALWWWRALWWWLRGKHRQGSHVRVFANSCCRSVHAYIHTYNLHIIILAGTTKGIAQILSDWYVNSAWHSCHEYVSSRNESTQLLWLRNEMGGTVIICEMVPGSWGDLGIVNYFG